MVPASGEGTRTSIGARGGLFTPQKHRRRSYRHGQAGERGDEGRAAAGPTVASLTRRRCHWSAVVSGHRRRHDCVGAAKPPGARRPALASAGQRRQTAPAGRSGHLGLRALPFVADRARGEDARAPVSQDSLSAGSWPPWPSCPLPSDRVDFKGVCVIVRLLRWRRRKAAQAHALAAWKQVRPRQGAAAAARLAEHGPADEWLASLEERLDDVITEESVEVAVGIWADVRRRQADAAAARLSEHGPGPAWLCALNSRLDDADADGEEPSQVEVAERSAQWGITALLSARSGPDGHLQVMANRALRSCLWMALSEAPTTGPPPDTNGAHRLLSRLDTGVKALCRRLGIVVEGIEHRRAKRLGTAVVVLMLVLAGASILAMASGYYLVAMGVVVVAVGLDVLEGTLGRITATETPLGRWVACLAGHLMEYGLMAAMAVDQVRAGHHDGAFMVLGALSVAQYASLVRTSARAVGERPNLAALRERIARLVAVLSYGALASWAPQPVAPVVAAVIFGGVGVAETLRVGRTVSRRAVVSIVTMVETTGDTSQSYVDHLTGAPSLAR